MKRINLFIIILTTILAGCATVGKKIDTGQIQKIEKGSTTRSDIISMIGPPSGVAFNADREKTATWHYTKVKNQAQNFIPIVGIIAHGMDMHHKTLVVIFDNNDIVKDFTYTDYNDEVRSGLVD